MGTYILQVICFQALFLAMYFLVLRRETFFQYNRAYLLITPILALVLPFIKIGLLQATVPPETFTTFLPAVPLGEEVVSVQPLAVIQETSQFVMPWMTIYIWGGIASFTVLVIKLTKLLRFFQYKKEAKSIIEIPSSQEAFTFFTYIFIGKDLDMTAREQVLNHERIHVKQGHTWDLILFEILKIAMWFNPLIYVSQKQLSIVHEYLADQKAVAITSKRDYYEELLNATFGTRSLSFTNTFFNQSLIKKRIIMLQKSKSKSSALLKYALIIPMVFAMLVQVSWGQEVERSNQEDKNFRLVETIFKNGNGMYTLMIKDSTKITTNEALFLKKIRQDESIDLKDITAMTSKETKPKDQGLKSLLMFTRNKTSIALVRDSKIKVYDLDEIKKETNGNTYSVKSTYVEEEKLDIPFAVIEQVPTYPSCENLTTNQEKKECMSNEVSKFVNLNFNTEMAKELGLTGINRIFVAFRINSYGLVDNVRVRAPHPDLEQEAMRVIYNLPKMKPGTQKGEPVGVLYSLPITFKIAE